MKPQTKEFLTKLADLLEEYGASFDAIEDSYDYHTYCSGIDIDFNVGNFRDEDWYWDFLHLSKSFNAEDIRKLVGEVDELS